MSPSTVPAKGAALFFEGHEYHFLESRKAGHLTFARPEDSDAPYKTVTVAAEEVERMKGSQLVDHASIEMADWIARVGPDDHPTEHEGKKLKDPADRKKAFRAKAVKHMGTAHKKLVDERRELFHLVVDGQPTRLVEPPVERAFLPIPKDGTASIKLGGSSVTQTKGGK